MIHGSPDPDIEALRQLLTYRGHENLANLLINARHEEYSSGTYGSKAFSVLSTYRIYSPIKKYDVLKNISDQEKNIILEAIQEIHPIQEYSSEFTWVEFFMDPELMNIDLDIEAGLYAYCTQCGKSQGVFTHEGDLRKKIAMKNTCSQCESPFSFLSDGRIWNLEWKVLPSEEDYLISLLEKYADIDTQFIFCYEDKGPQTRYNRYPSKKITSIFHSETGRASPAFAFLIKDKDSNRIEKSYCFDNPYALVQLAREALKGHYWVKYNQKT